MNKILAITNVVLTIFFLLIFSMDVFYDSWNKVSPLIKDSGPLFSFLGVVSVALIGLGIAIKLERLKHDYKQKEMRAEKLQKSKQDAFEQISARISVFVYRYIKFTNYLEEFLESNKNAPVVSVSAQKTRRRLKRLIAYRLNVMIFSLHRSLWISGRLQNELNKFDNLLSDHLDTFRASIKNPKCFTGNFELMLDAVTAQTTDIENAMLNDLNDPILPIKS